MAGALTPLQFTMSSYIAHSTPTFYLLIYYPSDTSFSPG
jgi:hypothetical protein